MQMLGFIHKLMGGTKMARTVDINDMLEKLADFNSQFVQVKQ